MPLPLPDRVCVIFDEAASDTALAVGVCTSVPSSVVFVRFALRRFAPLRLAPRRSALLKLAFSRFAPCRLASLRSTPDRSVFCKFALCKLHPLSCVVNSEIDGMVTSTPRSRRDFKSRSIGVRGASRSIVDIRSLIKSRASVLPLYQ